MSANDASQRIAVLPMHVRLLAIMLVMGLGVGLSLGARFLLDMDLRHAVAAILVVLFVAFAMIFVRRLSDLLPFFLVLIVPLLTFEKTFLLTDTWVEFGVPGFNVGLLDGLLLLLYAIWWFQIFGTRSQALPRITTPDLLVIGYVLANVLSLIHTASFRWTLFELYRVGKYFLAYFYISKRLDREYLKWIILALMFAVIFEGTLGVFQSTTQKLTGIARSKGADTEEMNTQYEVPGFESHRRAEGTTIDSHALGVYMVMLLAYPLCLAPARWVPKRWRLLATAAAVIGFAGLIVTFSRGAWCAFVAMIAILLFVFYRLKQWHVIRAFALLCILASPIVLVTATLLSERLLEAPSGIMSARWETLRSGLAIWTQSPITGRGANAYLHAQRELGDIYDLTNDKPAHDIAVYVLAQMGLIGLVSYLVMNVYFIIRGIRLVGSPDPLFGAIALAIVAGSIAVQVDGSVDFMAFTNQPYFQMFLGFGLIAGMLRLSRSQTTFGLGSQWAGVMSGTTSL